MKNHSHLFTGLPPPATARFWSSCWLGEQTPKPRQTSWKGHGRTALHQAVPAGHVETIKILLDGGACIETVTFGRQTALHIAARRADDATVKILLDKGANIMPATDVCKHLFTTRFLVVVPGSSYYLFGVRL